MSNENEWSDDNEDSDIPEQPDRGFPMSDEESESEEVQEKPKKKRREPPKGGSFGPTVGGF